jgi:Protein of unknown function (DUF1638)
LKIAVLSCGALAREVRNICENGPLSEELHFVKPLLHLYPAKLRIKLSEELETLQRAYDRIIVVYGQCLTEMDDFLAGYNAQRIPGEHCLEMIGGQRFWERLKENSGTYFLIPSWTFSFAEAIVEGLQLDKEPRMKQIMFRNYKRVVYFDTLLYGNLDARVQEIADWLELPLEIERTGVDVLRSRLNQAIEKAKA